MGIKWKDILTMLLAMAIPWVLLIGGWQVRNYIRTGSAEFSQIKSRTLLFYRGAGILALRDGISLEEARENVLASLPDTDDWTRTEVYALYKQEGLSLIKRYPYLFLRTQIEGMVKMMLGPGESGLCLFLGIEIAEGGPGVIC